MTLNEKYSIIESIFLNRLGCYFEKYGYLFTKKETEGDGKLESLQLVFVNKIINRDLTVSYLPFDIRGEQNERVVIFIARFNTNGVYSFKDILKHDHVPFDPERFCLLNYEGSFKAQVEQFCDYCIGLFDDYLQEWIKGEKWEDIPFDWGPYK